MIPVANPKAEVVQYRTEIQDAIDRVLEAGEFILGEEVGAFEAEFARYHGLRHATGVANGTDALELSLRALDVGPGHEVVTVAHTALATVAAIHNAGATPVLVDIEPAYMTLDPKALAEAVTERTRAIVPVHLYGQPCAMPEVLKIARDHDLAVVEDCAQAHGATLNGEKVGTFGDAAAFSFYPTKNLGALGDGGAVITDRDDVAERVRELRQYGWDRERVSRRTGTNSRLDELQAAVLRVKLHHLAESNAKRREHAAVYSETLRDTGLELPRERPHAVHAGHLYVARSPDRDLLRDRLRHRGIASSIHYPVPVHHQPAYSNKVRVVGRLVQTERAAGEVLSLPMYPALSTENIEQVIEAVQQSLEGL